MAAFTEVTGVQDYTAATVGVGLPGIVTAAAGEAQQLAFLALVARLDVRSVYALLLATVTAPRAQCLVRTSRPVIRPARTARITTCVEREAYMAFSQPASTAKEIAPQNTLRSNLARNVKSFAATETIVRPR